MTSSKDFVLGKLETNKNEKKIEYTRPSLTRRVFANLMDIIIFAFLFICLFVAARKIATSTSGYQAKDKELTELKISSGLYDYDSNNVLRDKISILDNATEENAESRKNKAAKSIDTFMLFSKEKLSERGYEVIEKDYRDFRLSSDMKINGIEMFIESDGIIIENPELISKSSESTSPVYKEYYEKCYKPYINLHAMSFLNTKIPGYFDLNKYLAFVIIFGEILPSLLVAMVITYLVPCFIFKRGRCTFGKATYRIALIDSNYLSPSVGRTFARFGLLVFEFLLAIPSFAATFLISFTMMLITKNKQGFPDYFLKLQEVNIGEDKIYINFNELDLDTVETHKEPIKFKTKNFD